MPEIIIKKSQEVAPQTSHSPSLVPCTVMLSIPLAVQKGFPMNLSNSFLYRQTSSQALQDLLKDLRADGAEYFLKPQFPCFSQSMIIDYFLNSFFTVAASNIATLKLE